VGGPASIAAPALCIVNPASGGGRSARLWPDLLDRLTRGGLAVEHALTRGPGHATALAADAARTGVGLVVAVGGDGTLNEVVNGLVDEQGRAHATVGVLFTGRGRDGARTLGLPGDPARAVARLLAGRPAARDLGLVRWRGGHRYFVTVAGAGFDAVVAQRALGLAGPGTIPYLRAVAGSVRGYRPWPLRLSIDGTPPRTLRAAGVMFANGPCCGGGMRIAPGADPTDGALDLVVLGGLSRGALVRWLPTVYWGGHLRHPLITLERVATVAVASDERLPLQVDGEPWGEAPFDASVVAGALRVVL
jgi:diacylglycerol kinase (ATP)